MLCVRSKWEPCYPKMCLQFGGPAKRQILISKMLGSIDERETLHVKYVRWKANLGGKTMEMRLVENFVDEFNRQVGNGIDVQKSPKAMEKLKKQIKHTKEILSANNEAPLSIESIYEDHDFRSTITRQKFEELCGDLFGGDLFEEALLPVKEILKHSGLKVEYLYAVELISGANRMPKL